MTIAVLLRVVSDQAELGKIVGRAEVVETGETFAFRDAAELSAQLLQLIGDAPKPSGFSVEVSVAEAPA